MSFSYITSCFFFWIRRLPLANNPALALAQKYPSLGRPAIGTLPERLIGIFLISSITPEEAVARLLGAGMAGFVINCQHDLPSDVAAPAHFQGLGRAE
jgi:hypothetical protein